MSTPPFPTCLSSLIHSCTRLQIHLYKQMVEEVDPSIRFCTYNIRRLGGDAGPEDEEGVGELVGAEGGSDILRSKLEMVLQESRAKQAKDLNEMEVCSGPAEVA